MQEWEEKNIVKQWLDSGKKKINIKLKKSVIIII
jgi:peptidyl-tRNA hydrolase